MSQCVWCGVKRSYYITKENASRQNCRESDSGYHDFAAFPCCFFLSQRFFGARQQPQSLLAHRRIKRPNTI
jgi:hypothetical protein